MKDKIKSGQYLGYCNDCLCLIVSFDIISRKDGVYTCPSCGKDGLVDKLLKERFINKKTLSDDLDIVKDTSGVIEEETEVLIQDEEDIVDEE